MDRNLAMELAAASGENQTIAEFMTSANAIFDNNGGGVLKPFAAPEIVFAKFIDYLATHGTKRERALVIISDKLQPVWKTLHIGVATLGEPLTESILSEAGGLLNSLKIFNLDNLLTDGLRSDIARKVELAAKNELQPKKEKLVYFSWMGRFWSMKEGEWKVLNDLIAKDEPFDLEQLGAKMLRSRPKGIIQQLRDVEPRGQEY